MKKILLLTLISISAISAWSQKEGNIWYFGTNAGISFNTSTSMALTDGQIAMREGSASICDKNGNLLFYTDGQKIYDKTHTLMPNGSGILGSGSSCQSALIIPWPDSTNKYFLVSVDAIENTATNGVRYTVIDMRLNGGNGDVVSNQKNIVLIKPQCEKATIVQHNNKKDFWLVTNQSSSDSMLAFPVTSTGINKTAIRSNTGLSLSGNLNNNLGYLNVSHDDSKLVSCHFQLNKILLMDFNNQTGKVSNVKTLTKASPYGAEFSPNNQVLYVSGLRQPTSIDQFDISSGTESIIQASKKQIFDYGSGEMGALKLAPDGKIYVTSETTTNSYNKYLGAIKYPNLLDTNCSYNPKALNLGGKNARLGLPNNFGFKSHYSGIKKGISANNIGISNIYPNPASNEVYIEYSTQSMSNATIKVFNLMGAEIITLSNKNQSSGLHTYILETSQFENGIYFVKLEVDKQISIQKLLISR